jgi:hypothetical protein
MRRTFLYFAFVFLLLGCVSLQAQTNKAFLNRIAHARFIMVTTENGDPFDPVIDSQDRRAAGEIQNMITQWKTFTLVYRKEDADVVIAVRTAGIVRANTGIHVSNRRLPDEFPNSPASQSNPRNRDSASIGPIVTADASSAKGDLFSVYDARDYPTSTILWRGEQKNGLSSPSVPLFDQFKKDVEKAIAANNKKP